MSCLLSSFAVGVVQVRASQGRRGRDTGSYADRGERREVRAWAVRTVERLRRHDTGYSARLSRLGRLSELRLVRRCVVIRYLPPESPLWPSLQRAQLLRLAGAALLPRRPCHPQFVRQPRSRDCQLVGSLSTLGRSGCHGLSWHRPRRMPCHTPPARQASSPRSRLPAHSPKRAG